MNATQDAQEYISAKAAHAELYAFIGTDADRARAKRTERTEVNKRLRESAENLAMTMLGLHTPRLANLGLLEFYKSMAAGKENDTVLYRVADETVEFLKA